MTLAPRVLLTPATPSPASLVPAPLRPGALPAPIALPRPVLSPSQRTPRWSLPARGTFADASIPEHERLARFIEMTTRFWDVKDIVSPAEGVRYASYLENEAIPSSPLRQAAIGELHRLKTILPLENDTAANLDRMVNHFGPSIDEHRALSKHVQSYKTLADDSSLGEGPARASFVSYLLRKIRHLEKHLAWKDAFFNRKLEFGDGSGLDHSAYREAVTDGLRARTPVDYASFFADNSVLLIGENHGARAHRREVLDHLDELKAAGVTHIFIEGVSVKSQAWLDGLSKNELRNYNSIGTLSVETFARAKELGLGVIAMDMPANTLDALKEISMRKRGEIDAARDVFLLRRNRFMAQLIAKTLRRQPTAKVVAIVGSAHAHALLSPYIIMNQGGTSLAKELASSHAIRSKTLRLVYWSTDSDKIASELIAEQGLASKRFFLPLGPEGGLLHIAFSPRLSTLPIPETLKNFLRTAGSTARLIFGPRPPLCQGRLEMSCS